MLSVGVRWLWACVGVVRGFALVLVLLWFVVEALRVGRGVGRGVAVAHVLNCTA